MWSKLVMTIIYNLPIRLEANFGRELSCDEPRRIPSAVRLFRQVAVVI